MCTSQRHRVLALKPRSPQAVLCFNSTTTQIKCCSKNGKIISIIILCLDKPLKFPDGLFTPSQYWFTNQGNKILRSALRELFGASGYDEGNDTHVLTVFPLQYLCIPFSALCIVVDYIDYGLLHWRQLCDGRCNP